VSAAGALVNVTTERRRPATFDGSEHFPMARCQPRVATFGEVRARSADQIGHLERWPSHLLLRAGPVRGRRRQRQRVQRARGFA
jgi:hypothetical protein